MKILELLNKGVDKNNPIVKPYIIAEVGVNHEGSMKTAKRLVDDAKEEIEKLEEEVRLGFELPALDIIG